MALPRLTLIVLSALLAFAGWQAHAQAADGEMSEAEVESLRDAAYVPQDRIRAYEKILDTREKRIEELLAKPRHADFALDMHDAIEQFSGIADELNDNLDEYNSRHRDVRKVLPKLIDATQRWSTALRAAGDNDAYKIVQRSALDALTDMRSTAEEMQTSLTAYFKDHPEALKDEKERASQPHAPHAGDEPQ
jgi:chromosome segregation ATPase